MLQLPTVKQSQLPTYPDFCMTLTWTINGAISVMDHQQPPRLNGEEEKLDSKWIKGTLQGSKHRQGEKMPPIATLTRSIWSAATVDVF